MRTKFKPKAPDAKKLAKQEGGEIFNATPETAVPPVTPGKAETGRPNPSKSKQISSNNEKREND